MQADDDYGASDKMAKKQIEPHVIGKEPMSSAVELENQFVKTSNIKDKKRKGIATNHTNVNATIMSASILDVSNR